MPDPNVARQDQLQVQGALPEEIRVRRLRHHLVGFGRARVLNNDDGRVALGRRASVLEQSKLRTQSGPLYFNSSGEFGRGHRAVNTDGTADLSLIALGVDRRPPISGERQAEGIRSEFSQNHETSPLELTLARDFGIG